MNTKNFFMAAFAIALCAAVTGCNNKNEQKAPEGTKMGNITVISKTNDAGSTTYKIVTADGYETMAEYTEVIDHTDFLEGRSEDGISLLNLDGNNFASCDSFSVCQVYPLHKDEQTDKFFKLYLASSGNHVARNYTTYECMSQVSGVKEDIFPLSNGWIIFKMNGKYGIAKGDSEEAMIDDICSEVFVVTVKDKTYYLVKADDYTGYIDETGKSIKPLTSSAYKTAKKQGVLLWSEANGKVGGIEKEKF